MRFALGVLLAGCLWVIAVAQERDITAPPTSEQPGIPPVQQPPAEQHDQRGAASDAQADDRTRREAPPAHGPVASDREQEPSHGLGQAEGNQNAVRDAGPGTAPSG